MSKKIETITNEDVFETLGALLHIIQGAQGIDLRCLVTAMSWFRDDIDWEGETD